MSLIHLNSENLNPSDFFNQFPNSIKIPRNSEVCLVGFSGKLKDMSDNITINSSNDSFTFTLNNPEEQTLARPFITAKIKHGTYQSKAALAQKITDALNEAEILSCFKHRCEYANDVLNFDLTYYRGKDMTLGKWKQWFGSNPLGGQVDICGNEMLITPATGAFNFIDKEPLWNCENFLTNGSETANPKGASWRINIKDNAIPVPTFLPDIIPNDLHYTGIASYSPSAFLTPGEFGQNILASTPFDQITQLFINTTDAVGINHAAQLGDTNFIIGRYLTIVSKDLTIAGREGVYGWLRIDSIAAYIPASPSPPTAATIIAYNVTFLDENLTIPNPPYTGNPFNFYTTEPVDMIFRKWEDIKIPATQLEMTGGIVCNPHVNYGWRNDTTAIGNANKDWANSGMSLNQKGAARPNFGWRIDNSYNLIAFQSDIETKSISENDTKYSETFVHTIDISDVSVNTLQIIIRPITPGATGEDSAFQLLYKTKTSDTNFTNGYTYELTEKFNVLHHLPIYQVVAFNDVNDEPVFVKGLHDSDISGTPINLAGPGPIMNYGFGRISKNNYPSMPDKLLNYINNNSNAQRTFNFNYGSYKVVSNAILPSSVPYSSIFPSTNPNLLIHLPTLPINGYVGGAKGGSANLVGVASGVNIYYPEVSDLYEQFNVQNWIKLNNKDDLNLTKLHCYITDVHNQQVNFLGQSTSIWLKFRTISDRDLTL